MMVCGTLCYVSFLFRRWLSAPACLCVFAALLMLVAQYTPLLTATNAACYFLGFALHTGDLRFERLFRPTLLALVPFALIFCYPDWRSWGFLAIVSLSVCFFCFVPAVFRFVHGKPLRVAGFIGRNTFPVYIFHPIFTMAAKFLLPFFVFEPTGLLHALFTIVMCLAGTLVLAALLDKTHLSWFFGRRRLLR